MDCKGYCAGDKDNHKMVLHAAMPLHLMAMICLILGPFEVLHTLWNLLIHDGTCFSSSAMVKAKGEMQSDSSYTQKSKLILSRSSWWGMFFVVTVLCGLVLWKGCMSHPFLLADNRC